MFGEISRAVKAFRRIGYSHELGSIWVEIGEYAILCGLVFHMAKFISRANHLFKIALLFLKTLTGKAVAEVVALEDEVSKLRRTLQGIVCCYFLYVILPIGQLAPRSIKHQLFRIPCRGFILSVWCCVEGRDCQVSNLEQKAAKDGVRISRIRVPCQAALTNILSHRTQTNRSIASNVYHFHVFNKRFSRSKWGDWFWNDGHPYSLTLSHTWHSYWATGENDGARVRVSHAKAWFLEDAVWRRTTCIATVSKAQHVLALCCAATAWWGEERSGGSPRGGGASDSNVARCLCSGTIFASGTVCQAADWAVLWVISSLDCFALMHVRWRPVPILPLPLSFVSLWMPYRQCSGGCESKN